MATRKIPIVTGEIYHVFNRSIARQPIYLTRFHYQRMTDLIQFYMFQNPILRFSHYNRLSIDSKQKFFENLRKNHNQQVLIYTHCIMPNHFHFLLKQTEDYGILKFISNLQNGYARFYNTKHDRSGSLFQEQFKAVHIETDEQLQHVMRYIILNPYSSYVLNELKNLENYPWTSLPEYMNQNSSFIDTQFMMSYFGSVDKLKQFIFDQADYQRKLDNIKHLVIE